MNDSRNLLTRTLDALMDRTGSAFVGDRLPRRRSDDDTVLENVPGYRQTQSYTCGFVAGLMVLHAFKPRASVDAFWKRMNPTEDMGVCNTRLIAALRASGIRVSVRRDLTFAAFDDAVAQRCPVITLVRTREADTLHWVVVYGVGRRPNRIYVAGNGLPYLSRKVFPWLEFRRELAGEAIGSVCGAR